MTHTHLQCKWSMHSFSDQNTCIICPGVQNSNSDFCLFEKAKRSKNKSKNIPFLDRFEGSLNFAAWLLLHTLI